MKMIMESCMADAPFERPSRDATDEELDTYAEQLITWMKSARPDAYAFLAREAIEECIEEVLEDEVRAGRVTRHVDPEAGTVSYSRIGVAR